MSRWLVTGAAGMLGQDVLARLDGLTLGDGDAVEATATDRDTLDITCWDDVRDAVAGFDVVLNCAAWTAVDDAETAEGAAFGVNALGPANLARAVARTGGRLLQVSTDYVFAGDATGPYPEDAPIAPRSAYGRTKAAGEWAVRAELPDRHWILRTAWLYGEHGPSFVRTMARLERSRETVDVVDDQHGQLTWSRDLAERVVTVAASGVPFGTYHATSSGAATWYDVARAVFTELGADPDRVHRTTSEAFARPAPRPAWSVLGHDAWRGTGLPPLRDWRAALTEAMATGVVVDPVPSR